MRPLAIREAMAVVGIAAGCAAPVAITPEMHAVESPPVVALSAPHVEAASSGGEATTAPPSRATGPDGDGDGIEDAVDACPSVAGTTDWDASLNGCPDDCVPVPSDPSRSVDYAMPIRFAIPTQIHFESDSAGLLPDVADLLDEIGCVLAHYPQIRRVAVEGYASRPEHNPRALSEARAATVMDYLVAHGIAPSRLERAGLGTTRPLRPNTTPAGRVANRRVEFRIVYQAPYP